MIFQESWRWFGPEDSVSLATIKQAGAVGVVTALHQIPVGEVWSVAAIQERKKIIEQGVKEQNGLLWNVVESLPIHEHIKQGKSDRNVYIENYKQSIKNLASCGIRCICYNFMPILDWLRTDVNYSLPDGSSTLLYNMRDVALFDMYVLKRENARGFYSEELLKEVDTYYNEISKEDLEVIKSSLLLALPGDSNNFTLERLKEGIQAYKDINREKLRENLIYFLNEVIPVAEAEEVTLAIHPDDPPWSVFGLPRIVSSIEDLDYIFSSVPSLYNGLTFCSGSLGASEKNDLPKIIETFYERIHFVHLRSVHRTAPFYFHEAAHLEGSVNMFRLVKTFYECGKKKPEKKLPMRPDHGYKMLDDLNKNTSYPGYSAIGRLKGLAEIRGLEMAIVKSGELS